MDVLAPFAEYIVSTKYEDLPLEVVDAAKQHLMHTLATAIAGSGAPGCETIVELVTEWGGREESAILVYGVRLPAVHAALANAAMAHALDFCLNDDRTDYKTSVVAVPAAVAVMESIGGVSGKELLTAIYLGVELGIRMALAINPKPAHALSPALGGFASAAAVGKALSLSSQQILDALSIAYCQVCTSGVGITSPSLTKRLTPGLAARAGVFSAFLAKKGFIGSRNIMQGPKGYFHTYHGQEGDLDGLTAELGQRHEIVHVFPKGYPCCRGLHASIEATLNLIKEHDITDENVQAVIVYESTRNPSVETKFDQTVLDRLRHPRGVVDAQFSIPWAVASAIVQREVFINSFTENGIKDPKVHRLADKVIVQYDPSLDKTELMSTPSVVEIRTNNGHVYSGRVDFAKGNPKNPVSMAESREVFRRCAEYAAKPLPKENIERAIDIIDKIEHIANAGELTRLLAG